MVYGALTWRDQQLADNQATMEAAPRFHGLDPTVPLVWIGPLPTIFTYRHHTCTLIGCPPSPISFATCSGIFLSPHASSCPPALPFSNFQPLVPGPGPAQPTWKNPSVKYISHVPKKIVVKMRIAMCKKHYINSKTTDLSLHNAAWGVY